MSRKSIYQYDKEYYEGRNYGNFYSLGSTAAVPAEEPEYEERFEEQKPLRRPETRPEREETAIPGKRPASKPAVKRKTNVSIISVLFLICAMGATLFVCVKYIEMHNNIETLQKEINTKKTEYKFLKESNDKLENDLNAPIDYDYIYAYAVRDLGMQYPSEGQIIRYEKTDASSVIQYGEIPEVYPGY